MLIRGRLTVLQQVYREIARGWCIGALLVGAIVFWAYWPVFAVMADRWAHEAQYSHGYLVPLFALYLLWERRRFFPQELTCEWSGLILVATGALLYLGGAILHVSWLESLSLIPTLFGACLIVGGRGLVRWMWPALCFLLFMLPLPYRIEMGLGGPLQSLATKASTATLIMLGFPATAEGNVITVSESEIMVAEACGGLSMCLTFLALAVGCALVIHRPLVDKLVLIACSIPIALSANVVRIVATGILYEVVGSAAARAFYHDFAGWFMMVLAIVMVWLILAILAHLFVESKDAAPSLIHAAIRPTAGVHREGIAEI